MTSTASPSSSESACRHDGGSAAFPRAAGLDLHAGVPGVCLIGDAIESALAQTWQNFELVVVDDGSTDSTLEVARSYSDPRIRVESNASNLGSAATHNRAIELSRGPYVKFRMPTIGWHPTAWRQ
jgi:cellulose synthase/poly-beta-1,6-N-acetylglucosamine synthase-like glycosyltransferase